MLWTRKMAIVWEVKSTKIRSVVQKIKFHKYIELRSVQSRRWKKNIIVMYVHQASVTGLSSLRVRCTAFCRTVMMIRSCSIDRVIDSQWTIVSLIIAASGSISTIYKRHPIAIYTASFPHLEDAVFLNF